MLIKLNKSEYFRYHGIDVPASNWRSGPFKFVPHEFAVKQGNSDKPRIYTGDVQVESLTTFLDNPAAPAVYGVGGAPDDAHALYFATYLVQEYIAKTHPPNRVHWEVLYSNYSNKLLSEAELRPTLLIISNLTPNSGAVKLEKARELLVHFSDIPRIVVIAGDDPVSFFTRKLYHDVNRIFYHGGRHAIREVDVV